MENACSRWVDAKEVQPERFSYVLVNTEYSRYPATVAYFNGIGFRSVDFGDIGNVTHWAKIIPVSHYDSDFLEGKTDSELLKLSIQQLDSSFNVIRRSKTEDEYVQLIFEIIGLQISELKDILNKK